MTSSLVEVFFMLWTSQAWLTFGQVPIDPHHFLANVLLSSSHTSTEKPFIQLTSNLVYAFMTLCMIIFFITLLELPLFPSLWFVHTFLKNCSSDWPRTWWKYSYMKHDGWLWNLDDQFANKSLDSLVAQYTKITASRGWPSVSMVAWLEDSQCTWWVVRGTKALSINSSHWEILIL